MPQAGTAAWAENAARISELKKLLAEASKDGNGNGAGSDVRDVAALGEALFARAPYDFLARTSTKTMLQITREAENIFRAFTSGDRGLILRVYNHRPEDERRNSTSILSVVNDCSFIVDTLTEMLKLRGHDHYVVLHPLLIPPDGKKLSLCYVEIDRIEGEDNLFELKQALETALQQLLNVTDDFSAMLVAAETAGQNLNEVLEQEESAGEDVEEAVDLIRWLADGGFVFLGFREWQRNPNNPNSIECKESGNLGLFRSADREIRSLVRDIDNDAEAVLRSGEIVYYAKFSAESPVHRRVKMDFFLANIPATGNQPQRLVCFLGLLTSRALAQEASSIPLIRRKLKRILQSEGLLPSSHDYKEVLSIANSLPKVELFQCSQELLHEDISLIMELQRRSEVRLSLHLDRQKRFASFLVVIPRERFAGGLREEIQQVVCEAMQVDTESGEYHAVVTDYPLVVLHLLVPNKTRGNLDLDTDALERQIAEISLSWNDKLIDLLYRRHPAATAQRLYDFYTESFPDEYKASISTEEALSDIDYLERLEQANPLELALSEQPVEEGDESGEKPFYDLKLYKRGEHFTLSNIFPYLDNIGFDIFEEKFTLLTQNDVAFAAIYDFRVRPRSGRPIDQTLISSVILPGLKKVFAGAAENDRLNTLILDAGVSYREVALYRTLARYLRQIKAVDTERLIYDALLSNPDVAVRLLSFVKTKFDPDRYEGFAKQAASQPERLADLEQLKAELLTSLKQVTRLIHDRVFRLLIGVVEAAVRTNYFRAEDDLRVAFKFDCSKIPQLPKPRPMFEIFVSSPDFDGVHLRGGRVARGGIRWSERPEDFRTEVLGLMKTQMVKNTIIIPVGAKGGFVVKRPFSERNQGELVRSTYRRFIQTLLYFADSRDGASIVHPPRIVRWDQDDPYFVVAADKGTATFSDVANELATSDEFKFWLGDAFASGGSQGYDHKRFGITARGAWKASSRHFKEVGIDANKQTITVTGIGDMSGDVFGNGLLLSRNFKLIGAFDHRHIFIDPAPDPEKSFIERERLFKLPRSSWADYSTAALSPGGGIYSRDLKEISLSQQARDALHIEASVVSSDELIKAILRAPVDLLWNGGIGTYVKASDEDNIRVGDRNNDDVRIDARELRAKVVAEGGNLGLTQRARIEFSRLGGHINTDAVDNSGGVNLSDLEVNLKILLSDPVRSGRLSMPARNELLSSLAEDVCEKVLVRNRWQARALSLAQLQSRKNIGLFADFIGSLERRGVIDRTVDQLPNDEMLERFARDKSGLTRPELAVIMAYSKMTLNNALVESTLLDDPLLQRYLMAYFPAPVVEKFSADILNHPLRREIIATEVANQMVDRLGPVFVHKIAEETSRSTADIVAAYVSANTLCHGDDMMWALKTLDVPTHARNYITALVKIGGALGGMTRWLLEHHPEAIEPSKIMDIYGERFVTLSGQTNILLPATENARMQERIKQLTITGFPAQLAEKLTATTYGAALLDLIEISSKTKLDVFAVGNLYGTLASVLQLNSLLRQVQDLDPKDRWEALCVRSLSTRLRRILARLTVAVVSAKGSPSEEALAAYLEERKEVVSRIKESTTFLSGRMPTLPALFVLAEQYEALAGGR